MSQDQEDKLIKNILLVGLVALLIGIAFSVSGCGRLTPTDYYYIAKCQLDHRSCV
jgi:hypothetical protein